MTQPERPLELFISYSHKDDDLREALEEHLVILQRGGIVQTWTDRRIVAGEEWAGRIDERLNAADVILLLISASFIASKYCYEIEMKRALERHAADEAIVIPVLVRACVWQIAPFEGLQMLPRDAKPVASWVNKDEAYTNITQEIQVAGVRLQKRREPSVKNPLPAPRDLSSVPVLLPYLCDRSDQEIQLGPALRDHREHRPHRPFVCFIHGDEMESHGMFLERLRLRTLPTMLGLVPGQMTVEDYPMRLPTRARQSADFWPSLGDALMQNAAATQKEIQEHLARHPQPVMLVHELLTEDFEESEDFAGGIDRLLKLFLKFCDDAPDLPGSSSLLHFISVIYQRKPEIGLLRAGRRDRQILNQEIREYLQTKDFTGLDRISGLVLPELESISLGDVLAWQKLKEVRARRQIRDQKIRNLFYQRPDLIDQNQRIPMETLAEELMSLLEDED